MPEQPIVTDAQRQRDADVSARDAAAASVPARDPALNDKAVEEAYERGRKEALAEAQRDQEKQAEAARSAPPEPTHYLQLADGRTVDGTGAIPTHVSDENGVVPVVRAWER